jgi:DNA-binding GntR family transcriptional regulator
MALQFERRLAEELKPIGLSVAGFRLVGEVMRSEGGLRQAELAQRLGVRAPTVSAAVSRLEAKGVVVRTRDPDDPRAWRIRIAEAAPLRHGFDVLMRIEADLAGALSEPARARLVAQIDGLTERVGGAK